MFLFVATLIKSPTLLFVFVYALALSGFIRLPQNSNLNRQFLFRSVELCNTFYPLFSDHIMSYYNVESKQICSLNVCVLTRQKDVGRPKADIAADFINSRIPECHVVPYPFLFPDLKKNFFVMVLLAAIHFKCSSI